MKIVFNLICIPTIILLVSCQQRSLTPVVSGKASNQDLLLDTIHTFPVNTRDKTLFDIRNFTHYGDSFSLADPYTNQACYLFNKDGNLLRKVGGLGQGPGEYQRPMGISVNGERIFVSSSRDRRILVYDKDANFISDQFHELQGVISAMVPWKRGFIAAIFSRYSDKVLHEFDEEGHLIRSFFNRPEETAPFDTFAPAGGLIRGGALLGIYFNKEYAITWVNTLGEVQKKTALHSGLFIEPDLKKASAIKGHKAEMAYRETFTQFVGVFKTRDGFVTQLLTWQGKKKYTLVLEFWDKNFKGLGRYNIDEEELFIGASEDEFIFLNSRGDGTVFAFKGNLTKKG